MSLPASARRRWGLGHGGEVGHVDLGDAVVLVPGSVTALRRQLLEALTEGAGAALEVGFGDEDLSTE